MDLASTRLLTSVNEFVQRRCARPTIYHGLSPPIFLVEWAQTIHSTLIPSIVPFSQRKRFRAAASIRPLAFSLLFIFKTKMEERDTKFVNRRSLLVTMWIFTNPNYEHQYSPSFTATCICMYKYKYLCACGTNHTFSWLWWGLTCTDITDWDIRLYTHPASSLDGIAVTWQQPPLI